MTTTTSLIFSGMATTIWCLTLLHAAESRGGMVRLPNRLSTIRETVSPGLFGLRTLQKNHEEPTFCTRQTLQRLRAGGDDSDDDEAEEDDKEENEEEDEEEDEVSKKKRDVRLSTPVPVVIQAKLGSGPEIGLLDQRVELTLQRRRTVAMIKENMRRSLPHKPPVALMTVLYEGRTLADDELIDDLLEPDEEDEDDEDDEEEEESDKGTLHLTLDMIPPLDGKFAQSMSEQLNDLNTADLLRLFATNEAALHENTIHLLNHSPTETQSEKGDEEDEDDEEDEESASSSSSGAFRQPVIPKIQERADQIENELKRMLTQQVQQKQQVQTILDETRPPSARQATTEIRGERVLEAVPSRGVKTSLRRKLQHSFNVQSWPDTIRYICLFVFFGLFGGRTPMSRLILLLGAPSVLILQARPVKLLWKQILYTLINDPPGIFLSLLPAPQQALFHLDMEQAMKTIYGPYAVETKDLFDEAVSKKKQKLGSKSQIPQTEQDEEFFDAQEEEEEEFVDAEQGEDDDEEDDEEEEEYSDEDEDEYSEDEE